jgi:exo-beta-1,3-glucanase (GH17 family)
MLGVDPSSSNPNDWDGGQASASLYIGDIVSPTVAVLSITWPDRDGKGIYSPQEGQMATIIWDDVPIWTKRTRDISTFGEYYAAQHRDVLATAVLTQSITHTLTFQVPASTAWDISTITIDLYPMWERLRGIAYSPFRDCQNPHWGPFPTEDEVEEDIARLFHMTNGIRTYSALNIIGDIPRIAHEYGLPVCAGAWLGREEDSEGNPVENKNREEIDALIHIAQTVPVDCVIVGNEVLLRKDLTATKLISYIHEVKDAVDVPVTTAEIGAVLGKPENSDVLEAVDLIMLHIYAYWDGESIDRAVDYVVQEYLEWRGEYPNKRVVIGETGWPSDGPSRGQADPSLENQRLFFYSFLAAAEQHDIEFYYFDAFDELWKREGGVGSHWGYAYADRTGKYEVQSVLIPKRYLFHWVYLPLVLRDGQVTAAVRPPSIWWILPEPHALPSVQETSGDEFVVFGEYAAEENHFAPSGWMGDWQDLDYYECDRSNPHSGQVAIRISYAAQGPEGWAGIYWQEPDGNWATIEGAGYDLDDATYLRFYARGEQKDVQVKFLMGGIWNPQGEYPDSQQPALSTDVITLTQSWKEYAIDLRGRDLSYVIGGFGFVTDQCLNPDPITFYLDDIEYVMEGDPGPPAPPPTPVIPYTFDIYRDKDIAGNHYAPSGWMGDTGDIILNECYRGDTHTGSTAIRVEYTAEGIGPHEGCEGSPPCNWVGVYWQDPAYNWGDRPGGYDLTGAQALTFWARGENGGEKVSFKIGGVGCGSGDYPDSLCPVRVFDPAPTTLTTTWQVYTVPLSADLDLSGLVGGFLWTASRDDNPGGATFYLDDIQYHFNIDMPSSFPFSTPPIPIGVGSGRTFDLEFGDGDNDGWLDLAVGNHGWNQVCWNNGDYTFDCQNAFGGSATFDVDWGHMNEDDYLDLVVANSQGHSNLVCLNNGGRTFTCASFSTCTGGAGSLCHTALGDVDNDGDLDIALGNRFVQDLIYYNDGTGTFPVATTITATFCNDASWTWTLDLEFGDVDNHDDLDLVVVGESPDYVCINDGSGTFTETRWLTWRVDSTRSAVLGDADGDGDLDIAIGGHHGGYYNNPIELFLNDGHGYFTEVLFIGPASDVTSDLAWGDVDKDGDLDLAVGNYEQPDVVYFNDPVTATNSITFTRKISFGSVLNATNSVAFGDVDNDCDLDLALSRDGGQDVIYLNTLLGGCVHLPVVMKNYPRP